jgi:hypothetical protein
VNVRIDRTPYILVLSPVAFCHTGTESGFVTMAAALVWRPSCWCGGAPGKR